MHEGSNEEYFTFCTPECAKAIDSYKDYRERYGEKITIESPPIQDEFNRRDPESVSKVRRLTDIGIRDIVTVLAVNSEVRKTVKVGNNKDVAKIGKIRHEVKVRHGMKKFAATNMIRAKIEPTGVYAESR